MTIVNLAPINQHFDFLFYSAQEVAKEKAIFLVEDLWLPSLDPEQQVLLLRNKIKSLRQELLDLDGKEYFQFATSRDFLKKVYVARMVFFESNDEAKLREAFILYESLALLEEKYAKAKTESCGALLVNELNAYNEPTEIAYYEMVENTPYERSLRSDLPEIEELLSSYQINDLIACMVPETGLINKLYDTNKKIQSQIKNQEIHLSIISEDIKRSYNEIYKSALSNLKHLIEIISKDGVAVFIIHQIGDIEFMIELAELDGYTLHGYFKHLKHFLKEQLHIILSAQSFRQPEVISITDKKVPTAVKPFSFGYHQGPKELKPILVAMDLKMNILTNGTTVDDFMEVLMCPDLSKNTKIIFIGFTTLKFAYFRKKAEPWFSSFTPTQIEKSGIFISQNEEPFKAHVLYNSTAILWEDSNQMDSIFDAKY